jgi:beta-N-acetylhexosaminidase
MPRFLAILTLLLTATAAAEELVAIDRQIDRLTTEERIAQLLFVGFDGRTYDGRLQTLVEQQRVGGVVLYANNIESASQLRALNAQIARGGGALPPFIAVDHEGGVVRRLEPNVPALPSAMALGATHSPELAHRAGLVIGHALRRLGFTMNFAPVLDLHPLRSEGTLETRAFSDDPEIVAKIGAAFAQGQSDAGIASVGKHFPGIGAAAQDTHRELPVLDLTLDELRNRDLVPFRAAAVKGLHAVMTGHVALPQITEKKDLPATLSSAVMTSLLRNELKFEGIAISDALQMKAIAGGAGPAAVRALLAGCDMVLALGSTEEREQVYTALLRAHRDGTISEERLRRSLRRILSLKLRSLPPLPAAGADEDIANEIARRAITLEGNRSLLLSLRPKRIALYVGIDGPLRRMLGDATSIVLPSRIDGAAQKKLLTQIAKRLPANATLILVAQTDDQWRLHRAVATAHPDRPIVYINLGSPHRTIDAKRSATLLTYSSSPASQQSVLEVILGNLESNGVLPVRRQTR